METEVKHNTCTIITLNIRTDKVGLSQSRWVSRVRVQLMIREGIAVSISAGVRQNFVVEIDLEIFSMVIPSLSRIH